MSAGISAAVRIERDPAFWIGVAQHPMVTPLLGDLNAVQIADVIARPNILPLASDHGGFLFASIDSLGRVLELHTLYTPEGWGREVHAAAKAAFEFVFDRGAVMVFTYDIEENPRSRPPRTFGFRPAGERLTSPHGAAQAWVLTREGWMASPGRASACH